MYYGDLQLHCEIQLLLYTTKSYNINSTNHNMFGLQVCIQGTKIQRQAWVFDLCGAHFCFVFLLHFHGTRLHKATINCHPQAGNCSLNCDQI